MNLRGKVFCGISLVGILFLLLLYVVTKLVFLDGFIQIENDQSLNHVSRFYELVSEELEALTTSTIAWSSWDDSYEYVKNPTKDFITKNYQIESIFDSNFSRVMYFTKNGDLLFSLDYNRENRTITPTSLATQKDFQLNIVKNEIKSKRSKPKTGFYVSDTRIEYFSLNPIYPNIVSGEPNGYIAFFRVIDGEALSKYKRILKFDVSLQYVEKIHNDNISFEKLDDRINATIRIADYIKRGQLTFKVQLSRRIFSFGENTFHRYMLYLLFATIVGVLFVIWLFDKFIILRILNLSRDLTKISNNELGLTRVRTVGEDEIGILSRNINQTLDSLDQKQLIINRTSKLSALGEIAASIAHEINNPLAVISGFSASIIRMINSDQFDKEAISLKLQKIKDNILRIEKIIKSLKFISRDGDNDIMSQVKLGAIIDDVESLCLETIKYKNVTIDKTNFNPELQINCRPVQIAQVLLNLINNAIDATSDQKQPWIKIESEKIDDKIILSVSDSGEIIPLEIAEKMLNPFFTTKSSGHGTGLGLSISKKIMESHGGAISFNRTPHTQFKLEFPAN